jgi:hypothetical protein
MRTAADTVKMRVFFSIFLSPRNLSLFLYLMLILDNTDESKEKKGFFYEDKSVLRRKNSVL